MLNLTFSVLVANHLKQTEKDVARQDTTMIFHHQTTLVNGNTLMTHTWIVEKALQENQDYHVEYSRNKHAGSALV